MTPHLRDVIGVVVLLGVLFMVGRIGLEPIVNFLLPWGALLLVILLTIVGIGALVFIYYDGQHMWSWWFPDQPFNPTVKRWLRYLLQAITAGVSYVEVRGFINYMTGVDPGNFPTALAALTALRTLTLWLLVLPFVLLVMSGVYALIASGAGIRGSVGRAEIGGIPARRWSLRAWGVIGLAVSSLAVYGLAANTLFVQRAVRVFAIGVLITTE